MNSRKQVHGSRLHHKPLPPPPEVIERDNAVRSVPNPVTETAEKSERMAPVTAPVNSLFPPFFGCSLSVYGWILRLTFLLFSQQVCPICLTNPKDMAFSCGHTVSETCRTRDNSCLFYDPDRFCNISVAFIFT